MNHLRALLILLTLASPFAHADLEESSDLRAASASADSAVPTANSNFKKADNCLLKKVLACKKTKGCTDDSIIEFCSTGPGSAILSHSAFKTRLKSIRTIASITRGASPKKAGGKVTHVAEEVYANAWFDGEIIEGANVGNETKCGPNRSLICFEGNDGRYIQFDPVSGSLIHDSAQP